MSETYFTIRRGGHYHYFESMRTAWKAARSLSRQYGVTVAINDPSGRAIVWCHG